MGKEKEGYESPKVTIDFREYQELRRYKARALHDERYGTITIGFTKLNDKTLNVVGYKNSIVVSIGELIVTHESNMDYLLNKYEINLNMKR